MSQSTSAPQKAGQNPATLKPLTTAEPNQNNKALITSVNSPSVKMFMGNVNKTSMGLISALIRPSIRAAIKALKKPDTVIPGTRYATNKSAIALKIQRINRRINPCICYPKGSGASSDHAYCAK